LISVAVDAPMSGTLDYRASDDRPCHGAWVSVPFGRKTLVGLVIDPASLDKNAAGLGQPDGSLPAEKIKPIHGALPAMPAADPAWIDFMAFAARYYRRPFGTVAVGLLPKWLRDPKNFEAKREGGLTNFDRLMREVTGCSGEKNVAARTAAKQLSAGVVESGGMAAQHFSTDQDKNEGDLPGTNPDQARALDQIKLPGVHVLHGVTGSGKTRVYTEAAKNLLQQNPDVQVLMMVPEIGLTPQLVARFRNALPNTEIAVLHSEISERERARLWLAAATGAAQLVIGTRLSIMTPMPHLKLIMIDEEHDHSYKQQEGMRYSARDLAVWRTQQLGIRLVLGSATPSVETWAQIDRNKYSRLTLPKRATGEPPAPIRIVDTLKDPAKEGLCAQSREAIAQVLGDGGQVLVFLNRRGYAPVLSCGSCGWSSVCADCSVATVLHKIQDSKNAAAKPAGQWRLQCHYCGVFSGVPRQCPDCGDTDLQPVGRGVQRLEQTLATEFPQARLVRIDRDSVKQAKHLASELERIQRGEVDIVVGTQMLAKGHDFARMRLVVVADTDTQLLNPDFRAPERLFATLLQVAGRAGRHEQSGAPAQVLIQTRYPQHRLYQYLMAQDAEGFARAEMADREAAGLPPYAHMAAVRGAHKDPKTAQSALRALRDLLQQIAQEHSWNVSVYGPVARFPETQAGKWRGQILMESGSRPILHQLLSHAEDWMQQHRSIDAHVDVDPYEV
jgi:primosomal protein N' (replication factor Y) (superfamily II helicase)